MMFLVVPKILEISGQSNKWHFQTLMTDEFTLILSDNLVDSHTDNLLLAEGGIDGMDLREKGIRID